MYKYNYTLAGFTALIISSGLTFAADKPADTKAPSKNQPFATAELEPKSDSAASGQVEFSEVAGGLKVKATVNGVTPAGKHGIHIHEKGDCSAPDAASAGGHFNPLTKKHAAPNQTANHIGDLGNIVVNEKGQGILELTLKVDKYNVEEIGGWDAIVGKAVIVHAKEDDLDSQPSGDAGGRIACGVIKAGGNGKTTNK